MYRAIEEWLEDSSELKKKSETILFIECDTFDDYVEDEQIYIGRQNVSVSLLNELLTDNKYYKYVEKLFNDEIKKISVATIYLGDIIELCDLSKVEIIKGLSLIIEHSKLKGINIFDKKTLEQYKKFIRMISFDNFLESIDGKKYEIKIDGINYTIPSYQIIDFVNTSDDQYNKIFEDKNIKELNGMPKEFFIYAVCDFFINNDVFANYLIPKKIETRIDEIRRFRKIDIEAINKIQEIKDDNLKNVNINEELRNYIFNGLPQDASKTEKAIYIYIKLCKTLTYDDEFYAVRQEGEVAKRHEDINNVSNINLDNNKVVCYEFNSIYGKFLEEIGINFETKAKGITDGFGGGHANLKFRSDKFIIRADSVTSILGSDMTKAKINQPLNGLNCINSNENTVSEFYNLVSKMYKLVNEQENQNVNNKVEYVETFEDILEEYNKTISEHPKISLDDKLDILINKVNRSNMEGIDTLSYVLELRNIIFDDVERLNNIVVSIFCNNDTFDDTKIAMASAIFTINKEHVLLQEEDNIYYLYNPNDKLVFISKEEIQEKFDNGTFVYADSCDPKIPGINEEKIKKCVKK